MTESAGSVSNLFASPLRKLRPALGLLLVLVLVLAKASRLGAVFFGLTPMASANLFWWSMALLVPIYVLAVEHQPLSSIGLKRPSWKTFAYGLAAAVVCFAILPVVEIARSLLQAPGQLGSAGSNALLALSLWFRVQLVLRASLAEEIVFRGYIIERVEQLTGSRMAALAVSVVAFTWAHLAYWGWGPLIGVAAVGIVLALFYQWRRDLGTTMVAHFVIDGLQVLL